MVEVPELDPRQLLAPEVVDEPDAFYRTLRERAPVWCVPGAPVVLVSSFAAISEAVRRTDDFSSNLVALLHREPDGTPGVHPFDPGVQALATADPPAHPVHRRAVFPELVARRMAELRPEIEELTAAHLDRALGEHPMDVMGTLANPIPIRVVSTLIGFRDEDPDELLQMALATTEMLAAVEAVDVLLAAMDRSVATVGWIFDQVQAAVDGAEADGILAVVGAAVRSGELEASDAFAIMATLLSAGGESTTSLVGNAVHLLASDPELQEALRGDPALLPAFIEEALRLESPFRYHLRHVPRTTELHGVTIPGGSTMLLLWGAANRDPAEFDRPDEVVLDRPAPRHHVAFGRGVHLCVGAPLARLEAEVILGQLLQRTEHLALDPTDPPVRARSLAVRRFDRLPVTTTAS